MNLIVFYSTLVSAVILSIILQWEPPIQISRRLFEVVTGYATILDEQYDVENEIELPILKENIKYSNVLGWSCDVSEFFSPHCHTTVSLQYCANHSQYSYTYLKLTNIICMDKYLTEIPCQTPEISNGSCLNIVKDITIIKNSTQLVLTSQQIGSDLHQRFLNISDQNKSCYLRGDPLIWQGRIPLLEADSHGNCVSWNSVIEFGKNYSNLCLANSKAADELHTFSDSNAVFCNCAECLTNIQSSDAAGNSSKQCPSHLQLILTVSNGNIISAILKENWDSCKTEDNIPVRSYIMFLRASYMEEPTIFDKQQGMFECPSERLCWKEVAYPMMLWNTITNQQQIILLLLSLIVTVFI